MSNVVDAGEIDGAGKQICIYTTFICQSMMTYVMYSIFKIILIAKED